MILAGLTGLLILLVAVSSYFWEEPEENENEQESEAQRFQSTREMMDTYVMIIAYHNDEEKAMDAMDTAFERIEEIEAIASRFNASSEVSRLNSDGVVNNPSPELVEIIETSIQYWEITDGKFDITIMPLLDLWSSASSAAPFELFEMNQSHADALDSSSVTGDLKNVFVSQGYSLDNASTVDVETTGQEWTIKSGWVDYSVTNYSGELTVKTQFFWNVNESGQEEYIDQARQFVGSDMITVTGNAIALEPGMNITLDGIAKGYAVDAAMKVLQEKGIERALIDAGGDIATLGTKPNGEKWLVGLRNPDNNTDSITEFELSGQAIATSGNYERYFNESHEVGHIMDPDTGRDVFRCSSSTIIASNCTVADILATAIFVLGPVDGITLVETLPDTEALLLGYDDPKVLFPSSGLDELKYED